MLFACKCLNISVNQIGSSPDTQQLELCSNARTPLLAAELQLILGNRLSAEQQHFFKQAIGPIDVQGNCVIVQHAELVRTFLVGESTNNPWTLHLCINCDTMSHAIDASGRQLLVNPETITNEQDIQYMKSSVHYSKTFGVLMNQTTRDFDHATNIARLNNDNTEQYRRLAKSFRNSIQQEIEATDERIRQYTTTQFGLLKTLREKAEQEFSVLIKIIKSVPETTTGGANTDAFQMTANKPMLDTPPATPESTPMSIGNSPNFQQPPQNSMLTHRLSSANNQTKTIPSVVAPVNRISRNLQVRQPVASQRYPTEQMALSYGGGGAIEDAVDAFFFEMDGVAARETYPIANAMSDVEESDSNESLDQTSEAISIPRTQGRPKSLSIAQSLPISMPISNEQRPSLEDEYDEYSAINPDDNVDIAASIKALARSVHGDAVFGDLPRPRFSTQI